MAAVHILIFGEMAGFKIVLFIVTHVKIIFFSRRYEKKKKKKKNDQPIRTRQFA